MYIDNAYINPISYMSNNIRHLLLSLFSIPFMILPYLISKILFLPILMPIFVQFIHSAMIIIVIILIKRMLNIRDTKLEAIFYLLFFTSSTTILNLLVYEKFVISMFYLVLTVYATHKNNAYKYILFIASIGTLSTNIFLAPFVFYDKNKKFGDIMREIIICIVSFIFIIVLYGQINNLVFFQKGLNSVLQFSGNDLSFIYKLAQFFEMFCTFFIIPKTNPIDSSLWYHTSQIDSVYSIIGMFLLVISVVGFILNAKNKYIQFCFYWLIITIFITLVIGWGSALNEMFIYSTCFIWAIFPLIFSFFNSTIGKNKTFLFILLVVLIINVFAVNIYKLVDIVRFGVENYPSFIK